MYVSWIEDQNQKHKFARDYSVFLGSFSNPEAARKIAKSDEPDYESSDEDFEGSIQRVIDDRDKIIGNGEENQVSLRHRRRRQKKVIK